MPAFQPANQLMYIKRVLYKLKQNYGGPMEIYQTLKVEIDQKTGKQTEQRRRLEIDKAVLLPNVLTRKFSYDLSFIAANKNFTYGGNYDVNQRLVILDAEDLPDDVKITDKDYAVIENHRYEVKLVERLEHDYGYLLTIKETVGALPQAIITMKVGHRFSMEQRASGVI